MKSFAPFILIFLVSSSVFAARPDLDARLDGGAVIKSVVIPEGSVMARVRVEAIIVAPLHAVWDALQNIERWPAWLPMNRTAQFLSPAAAEKITPEVAKDKSQVIAIDAANPPDKHATQPSGHWTRMVYEEYNLPWPLNNEWVVRNYTFDENGDDCRAAWRKVDSTEEGDDGSWEVGPWKDDQTLLKYYYRVKAKKGVPEPIFKTAVSFTVNSMIKALRHEAKRSSLSHPQLSSHSPD